MFEWLIICYQGGKDVLNHTYWLVMLWFGNIVLCRTFFISFSF